MFRNQESIDSADRSQLSFRSMNCFDDRLFALHSLPAKEIAMGNPVVHWEFWSQEPGKISDFYARVFDWKIQNIPEMDYNLVHTGGTGGIDGGIMKPKEGPWPGKLALYIDVDDLAAYCEKIKAAGGKILVESMDVPGVGAFSLFEDPDGRVLGLWKQLKQE